MPPATPPAAAPTLALVLAPPAPPATPPAPPATPPAPLAAPPALAAPTRRQKRPDLIRDQRMQALTLNLAGWTYIQIADHLKITRNQVQTACKAGHPTPKKRDGRPLVLSEEQA